MIRTRFAPSPTGPLHLGHAYSALMAHDFARAHGGEFLIRIEDLDTGRVRPHWEQQIFEDLDWLGLTWTQPVVRQSERLSVYAEILDHLWSTGMIYACRCTRRDIQTAIRAPQEGDAPLHGPDGMIYPGTCRPTQIITRRSNQIRPIDLALRLDMARAMEEIAEGQFSYQEIGLGGHWPETQNLSAADAMATLGDIVVVRKHMPAAYHLAVVIDDAAQGVTHVVRGQDLASATSIHVILQRLLKHPTPVYYHHALIRDDTGKRLAKRDDARAIRTYREQGYSAQEVRKMAGL